MLPPTRILIHGGRVIDPAQQLDRVTNILLEGRRVAAFDVPVNGQEIVIDATNKIVAPGLVDMQVELREPGLEEDETIETGTAAAVAGGFTSIACLPNTDPPIDSQASVEFVRQKAARAGNCHVFVVGCVSRHRAGEQLAEIGALYEAGAVAFSDADRSIGNTELMRRALEYCLMFDKPILSRPEVRELTQGGIMHEGVTSMVLGLAGIPADAEDVMTARDLRLAEATGGRLHLMSISSSGSVELIRRAKSRGMQVTAAICPQHFTLTDDTLRSFDPNCKLKPPLRSADHLEACIAGIKDGTLDVISSGHSPRAAEKKMRDLDEAEFGMAGLETALSLVITQLIEPGHLEWPAAISMMSTNPARILGLKNKGHLAVGADADVAIIDPHHRWTVSPANFRSKSGNTPLAGWELRGRAEQVIVSGELKL